MYHMLKYMCAFLFGNNVHMSGVLYRFLCYVSIYDI